MTAAAIVAVVAAVIAIAALIACFLVLARVRSQERMLERELERGREQFDAIVAKEIEERSRELELTLTRERAESLSRLAEEERRIAAERRLDVAERERSGSEQLAAQLVAAQKVVEQRLASWTADVEKLQEGLTEELRRIETRQRQLMAEIESRIGKDADGLQLQLEEQRQLIARQRDELTRAAQAVVEQANVELEQHGAERRRALQEIADRLRRRESELKEIIDRESSDAAVRVQSSVGDIERRQVEQLQRVVARETQRYTEAASQSFDTTIRSAREDAARRLSRELDLAVERFARQAEGVLTERLNALTEAAGKRMEERIGRSRGAVERQRDEALQVLEDRAHAVEAGLRERLRQIAHEAEAERGVLESRLHELQRRLDEMAARI
ncbi:MAG TPA: hypothetical protein VLV46_08705 [Gaiellaceae bacterium]|nr:hypothetical protein [Gaiellaceae bacterium]